MYLAFLMIAALDLLDALTTVCNVAERKEQVDWIYHCQHPDGGFRMWPGTDFGDRANESNARYDPANVPATYFALSALLILGDDFKRVRRRHTLRWLQRMQREDGSFGETFMDGKVEGGRDPRFGYCGAGIRYLLRGRTTGPAYVDGEEILDVDVDALVRCIRAAETFDGGMADEPFHEPHAGYTFCSLGALNFVGRLNTGNHAGSDPTYAPSDPEGVLSWLVYRQTDLLDPDASLDSEFIGSKRAVNKPVDGPGHAPTEPTHQSPDKSILDPLLCLESESAGMNGRTNKVADTCYAWWAGAPFHMLEQPSLYDQKTIRRYLLEKTQHPVLGGFGKFPGDLPDLYHSYLGLAALSLAGSSEVKQVDAGMCVGKEASARLKDLWHAWDLDDAK